MGQGFVGFPGKGLPLWAAGPGKQQRYLPLRDGRISLLLPGSINYLIRAGWGVRTGSAPDKHCLPHTWSCKAKGEQGNVHVCKHAVG